MKAIPACMQACGQGWAVATTSLSLVGISHEEHKIASNHSIWWHPHRHLVMEHRYYCTVNPRYKHHSMSSQSEQGGEFWPFNSSRKACYLVLQSTQLYQLEWGYFAWANLQNLPALSYAFFFLSRRAKYWIFIVRLCPFNVTSHLQMRIQVRGWGRDGKRAWSRATTCVAEILQLQIIQDHAFAQGVGLHACTNPFIA